MAETVKGVRDEHRDMPQVTYDRSAEHFVLQGLGLELDEAGYVKYESGGYVPTVCGEEAERIDRVGGFAHDESAKQNTKLVHNSWGCVCKYVESKRQTEDE